MKNYLYLFFLCVAVFANAQNVGINNTDPQAALDLKGDLRLRSETLSGIINSMNDNVNISTLKSSIYKFDPSLDGCLISGFTGGIDGRTITIFNNSSDVVQLIDESDPTNGSLDVNKILTGTGNTAIIGGKGSVTLRYDESKMRWTIVSSNFTSGLDDNPNPWYTDGVNIFNQNSGNVGIGSQSPFAKLHVEGATSNPAIPGMASNGIFRINSNNASGLDVGQLDASPFSFWMQGGAIGVAPLPLSIQPQGGNVGIGTTAPATTAILDVASTTQGFLIPRMTKVQRDAIAAPAEGLMISCTDCSVKGLHQYINGAWQAMTSSNTGNYGTVVNPVTGKIWLDRNLGATQVATSSTDAASYGDLYQWGRNADGHQIRTSGTTATQALDFFTSNGLFNIGSPNWLGATPPTTPPTHMWSGTAAENNSCPSGFRIPTAAEWEQERRTWSGGNNAAGAFASPLKLPMAGYRGFNGSLFDVGTFGGYWSSTVSGSDARGLYFSSGGATIGASNRTIGYSVRCIKD